MKTTKQHTKYWQERKINWAQDYLLADGAMNHPHRDLIIKRLSQLHWRSLLEVGMGAGANLVRIKQQWPAAEVGGTDINQDAVLTASKYLDGLVNRLRQMVPESEREKIPFAKYMDVGDPRDIFLSDKSVDIALSDACLIYFGPRQVKQALRDMKRIARNYLVLCELHSEKKVWFGRYNVHNYRRLLQELDCFDIQIEKIPKEVWPGTPWEEWGHIISATFI